MGLISEYVDQTELGGGRFRNLIHMRPIAVRRLGSLLRMSQDFGDGDATFPQIVDVAPLRVRTKNDGTRRLLPIPGDDTKWLELGALFVQVGGNWTQVSLGTPSRVGNVLTWTRPQTITTVTHGGHFLDMQIELRGGFVPENSRIAFPVGISGLTRSGVNILDGGNVVARLRPFQMIDAAAPLSAPRPISHQFTTLNGQPYLLLTLPSLTGMTRPTIDPTLELQPASGGDTWLLSDQSDRSTGSADELRIGHDGDRTNRSLIKFDLSSLPDAASISSAILSLYIRTDLSGNARTFRVYRQKRAWIEGVDQNPSLSGATWNKYDVTNNFSWQAVGGFGANDCEQTDIGSAAFTATETVDAFKDFVLTPTTKTGLDLGNGWLIRADVESNDGYRFASSNYATASQRPKLTVTYTEAAARRMMLMGVG